jgi:hypothetical protein
LFGEVRDKRETKEYEKKPLKTKKKQENQGKAKASGTAAVPGQLTFNISFFIKTLMSMVFCGALDHDGAHKPLDPLGFPWFSVVFHCFVNFVS